MNFDFSDEQKQIRDQARELLSERVSFDALRAFSDSTVQYDEVLWAEVSKLGWLSLAIPEEYGGLGLDGIEECLLNEELGRSLAPLPFASTCIVSDALRLYGSLEQKARYLPAIAAGELIGAFAFAEDRHRQTPDYFDTRYADGKLNGIKRPVADGAVASIFVVAALDPAGAPSLYLADATQDHVRRRPVGTFDRLRRHAVVEFADAQAEPLQGGTAALNDIEERAAIRSAFEQVGGADACIAMATSYVMERKTFGRLVGSYQAVKHRLADMYTETELARSNAWAGAWALSQAAHVRSSMAANARLSATHAFNFSARENLHLHGGIGYTWEANCHFFFRRASLLASTLGPRRHWVDRSIAAMMPQAA